MSDPLPLVLLVCGGWHTPASYTKLTEALSACGFEVHVPALESVSEQRPPKHDLESDTALIRSFVEKITDDGYELLVLMHSYGGQVGSNALSGLSVSTRSKKGLKGGVSHLIYMTATAVAEGKSMIDTVRDFGHEHLLPLAFDFADDMSCIHRDPKLLMIGDDDAVLKLEREAYLKTLGRWNGNCMYQPLTTKRAAWRDGPVTYVHTTTDMTVPMDYQKSFVKGMEDAGVQVQCVSVETGHCPNLTRPTEIAEILRKIAVGEAVGDRGEVDVMHGAGTNSVEYAINKVGYA